MAEKLEILITAEDAASGVINGLKDALGGLGSIAKGALTVGLGVATAAGAGLVAGLGVSISEALDAQKTQAQLAQVIKSTGGAAGLTQEAANQLADQFKNLAGGSDDAILAIETIALRMGTVTADEMPAFIQQTLDLGAVMGSNEAAAQLLALAQDDVALAMTKARRAGVLITQEKQKEIDALLKAGKTAEANKIFMEELAKATGGAAQANAETLAGKWEIFSNRVLDAAEGIGTKLLPSLEYLFGAVIEPALPFIEDLAGAIGGFIEALGSGDIGGAFDALTEFDSIQTLMDMLGLTAEQVWELGGAVESAFEWIQKLASGDVSGLVRLIPPELLSGIRQLAAAIANDDPAAFFAALDKIGGWFAEWAGKLWQEKIAPQIPIIVDGFLQWIDGTAEWLRTELTKWGQAFVDWIAPKATEAQGQLNTFMANLSAALPDSFIDFASNLIDRGIALVEWIGPQVGPALTALGAWMGSLTAWIVSDAIPTLVLALSDMAAALSDWIVTEAVPKLGPKLFQFQMAIDNFMRTSLSPALIEMGKAFYDSLAAGMEANKEAFFIKIRAIGENIKTIFDNLNDHWTKIGHALLDHIMLGISQKIVQAQSYVRDLVRNMIAEAGRALGELNPFTGGVPTPTTPGGVPGLLGPGGAHGLYGIVPPGFPNDTYPIRASSGEEVLITRPGESNGQAINIVQNIYYPMDYEAATREIADRLRRG